MSGTLCNSWQIWSSINRNKLPVHLHVRQSYSPLLELEISLLKICLPLFNLRKKEVIWRWEKSEQEAFSNLKTAMCSYSCDAVISLAI